MQLKYFRFIKTVSVIVLFLFCWVFAGGAELAYAIKNGTLNHSVQGAARKKEKTAPEKFNKSLDDIEQIIEEVEKIGRLDDEKKNRLKTKKTEIEALDNEIRKQFKATEQKLKDAGLPEEILQRHKDFVKHYEDNLNELNSNLDAVDKAKTDADTDIEVEKLREFLKKANPPKKHIPLDPNKLPHRTPDVEKKEPRLKKEDFQQTQSAEIQKLRSSEAEKISSLYKPKLILVAANGPLDGLLDNPQFNSTALSEFYSTIDDDFLIPNSEFENPNLLLAAADPPTDADLAETIEVQFTPDITAKAEELENNPVKIYNWVRNNIEFVPTYGSIQGADYCLQTKLCNAIDTASLLITLLRVSGIHARYAEGTVELPIEKVMNWAGGFTDSMSALGLFASAGIPTKGMQVGGEIKYAQIEHVWVEAWIDYIPSRGARHKQGDTWIPLDASYKQYNYTDGIDIESAVPFDAEAFVEQIQSTATINEEEGYVTGVDSLFIESTMTDYQTQVENYITANYPDATVGDVLGTKEIIQQEFSYLLGTLPYRTILKGVDYADIPDSLRHKINFNVVKDIYDEVIGTPINITKSLPELAGKKITLSYSPATQEDEDVINSYLPEPHEDGTPIDPSELPTSLPAYLINLKPELMIDGEVIATGTSVGMGVTEEFKMTFTAPNMSADLITNNIEAGEYLGIGLDLGRISQEHMEAFRIKLEETKVKLEAEDFEGLTKDDVLGDILYTIALSYYAELDVMDLMNARTLGIKVLRLPSETIFSSEMQVNKFFGSPMSAGAGGMAMDLDRAINLVKALDGNTDKPKQFMLSSGMNSSALEHSVPEQIFSTPDNPAKGISAVKALKIANEQGIPIYTINQTNIDTILPQLQLDAGTITDIQNAVNAGSDVTVSQTDITYNGWTGCGYIIIDPETGAGAYMISGGLSGGWLILLWVSLALLFFLLTITFTGPLALILIAIGISVFQLLASSFIKYSLEWDDYQITRQQGIAAIADIIIQITLGVLTRSMLPPGIASEILYIFKVTAATLTDWIIFFFAAVESFEKKWAIYKNKAYVV